MNIDLRKKFQTRIFDSLDKVKRDSEMSAYSRLSDGDLRSIEERGIQAGILSNFKSRVMDSGEARDFVKSSNYGPFLPELWPIITAWYPEFPLKELISVQDMDQDLAYIITSKLLTATNKADTAMGDAVSTPTGRRTIHGRYPTGEVFGEELKFDDFTVDSTSNTSESAVAYYPVMMDTTSLEMTRVDAKIGGTLGNDFVLAPVTGTALVFSSSTLSCTVSIETTTGIVTVNKALASDDIITISYVWNIEYATDNDIPSLVEDMQMTPLIARPRVLGMKWTIFSEYVKKKQFGTDVRTQTTERALNMLYQYQTRYILDRLYNNAEGPEMDLTLPSDAIELNLKVQKFLERLNEISNEIMQVTGRIEGNQLIVGTALKSFLESLPDIYYKPNDPGKDYGFNGPRKIGEIGRYKVYFDDYLPFDKAYMTYRGQNWYDAAFYLGVFLPMAPTDAINININVRQAFVEMCAYKYDKPQAVFPISFYGEWSK